ncbi:MAG: DNA replication protein DnaC [Candidatus Celerinatantimonas neptuna]|nr:MAG: DNA replication protein DnaC [Candidatus Celerinatantimonas neptuna]
MNHLMKKLQHAMPASVTPEFKTFGELQAYHQREAEKYTQTIIARQQRCKIESAMGRSGIKAKYQHCTLDNYRTDLVGYSMNVRAVQHQNLVSVRQWMDLYRRRSAGGFVMMGSTGTGKNHLASAIGNAIIERQGSVLIATVSELMRRIKDTYRRDSALSESKIIAWLASLDLLVLDEVGLQFGTQTEVILLNEIINQRSIAQKPTGILTNLSHQELKVSLGERAIDRIMEGHSMWLVFNWASFRKTMRRVA